VRLYHSTPAGNVPSIRQDGFRDARGNYLTTSIHQGVWLASRPMDWQDAGFDERDVMSVLEVEIPENLVVPFEWTEEGKPYREFLVPAELVNCYPIQSARALRSV
jgi:hypothetical protein